jgi:hypothetical protein
MYSQLAFRAMLLVGMAVNRIPVPLPYCTVLLTPALRYLRCEKQCEWASQGV